MDEAVVGVVGEAGGVTTAVEDAGGRVASGEAAAVLSSDPSVIVAVGERAVSDVARREPGAPILPVDAGRGLRSVPADAAASVADTLVDGDWATERHPLVAIERDGNRLARALADVTVVTAEAAHISEFSVLADGSTVGRFRADGVVIATPAGTPGYARRIGCPILAPGTDVVAVAPIAPFATNPDHWVLPLGTVRLGVEREEASVTLLADDREVGSVGVDEPLVVRREGSFTVAVTGASRSRYR